MAKKKRVSSKAVAYAGDPLGLPALVTLVLPAFMLLVGADTASVVKTFGAAVFFAGILWNVPRSRGGAIDVRVDAGGLQIGDARVPAMEIDDVEMLPAQEMESSSGEMRPIAFRVHVRSLGGARTFSFRTEEEATKIVDALRGIMAPAVRARFITGSADLVGRAAVGLYGVAGALALVPLFVAGFGWTAAVVAGVVATVALAFGSTPVLVRASDEQVVYARFGRVERFALADVLRWTVTRDGGRRTLVVRLRNGGRVTFHERVEAWAHPEDVPAIDRIASVLEASAASAASTGTPLAREASGQETVRRLGRSVRAWAEALQTARDEAPRYRVAATPAESLWEILEDDRAPDDARVGAAVALRSAGEAEVRIRIAEAATRTANPDVRDALTKLADEEADVIGVLERVREE